MEKLNWHKLQRLFFVALSICMFSLASCNNDDEDIAPVPTQNIHEILEAREGFDSLLLYLEMFPELEAELQAQGDYTFFAPDNDAFAELLSSPGFPADIRAINPDIIKVMLEYHLIENQSIESDELDGQLSTAANEDIEVNDDYTLNTGAINKSIEITESDIQATNGVIHVVESVLVPPSASAEALAELLGNLAGAALLSDDFSYLSRLIKAADDGVAEADQITTLLKGDGIDTDEDGTPDGLSVLFPPNAYFVAVADAMSMSVEDLLASYTANPAALRTILKRHVIPGKLTTDMLSDNYTVTTVAGTDLVFKQVPTSENTPLGYVVYSSTDTDAQNPVSLLAGDIQVMNGYLHVSAGVFTE